MAEILKGNFQTRNPVETRNEKDQSLEEMFENAALKRLGGSIAFVSRKKVSWDMNEGKKREGDS